MRHSSTGSRAAQEISESLLRHVSAYALAASAAGVSLLALAQPVEAEIVYTPANGTVPLNGHFRLDMNHDGTPDFGFYFYTFAYHSFGASLEVNPRAGGGVMGGARSFAFALLNGGSIGPRQKFNAIRAERMLYTFGFDYDFIYYRRVSGLWANQQNRFLGVEFLIDGELHYGWIRLTVTLDKVRSLTATVTGYAYETVANQSIKAGQITEETDASAETAPMEPASLGMLALGSQGLALWRRE